MSGGGYDISLAISDASAASNESPFSQTDNSRYFGGAGSLLPSSAGSGLTMWIVIGCLVGLFFVWRSK